MYSLAPYPIKTRTGGTAHGKSEKAAVRQLAREPVRRKGRERQADLQIVYGVD